MKYPAANCWRCPLKGQLSYYVPGKGAAKSAIVVVGEAPGEQEARLKLPFAGASGRKLDSLLQKAGIKRDACYITTVLKCRPEANRLPDNLKLAIECCAPLLEEEIKDAKVILGLGGTPLLAFTGLGNVTKRRGSVYKLATGQPFVSTLHPAYLIRLAFVKNSEEGKMIPEEIVVADLVKVRKIAEGEIWEVPENYILFPNEVEFQSFLDKLNTPEILVGVDIETTRANPSEAVPLTIAFALFGETLCADFETDIPFIYKALISPAQKVFHNGLFDVMVLENADFTVTNWTFDTLYAHHLLYAELPHSLGFVQSIYTNLPFHKHMRDELEEVWEK